MSDKINSGVINNFLLTSETFDSIKHEVDKASEIIARKIENSKRIIFVCVGITSDIVNGFKVDLEFNFGIEEKNLAVINAGIKYKKHIYDWKEIGALKPVATFDLMEMELNSDDLLIGVSSSGKTEYVMGALSYANDIGCETILFSNNSLNQMDFKPDVLLSLPFVSQVYNIRSFEGATLLKVLLDITLYESLEKSGRIYEGCPIFMKWNSQRSRMGALNIISKVSNISTEEASDILEYSDGKTEIAVIVSKYKITKQEATEKLFIAKNNFNKID